MAAAKTAHPAAKPAKRKPALVSRTSTKTADTRPAPQSYTTPNGVATVGGGGNQGNSTLDLAAMGGAGTGATGEQVTTSGGPGQDDAVYSTGPAYAPQLNYQQTTTYAETVAQQLGGSGAADAPSSSGGSTG